MLLLTSKTIKSKKDVYRCYLGNMSIRMIKNEIQYAMYDRQETSNDAKLLTLREVVIFIASNDEPAGYELDPEMKQRVQAYREIFGKRPAAIERESKSKVV